MSKYKFEMVCKDYNSDEDILNVKMSFREETLPEVIRNFEQFLKAVGFYVPPGHSLDWVKDEDYDSGADTDDSDEDNI